MSRTGEEGEGDVNRPITVMMAATGEDMPGTEERGRRGWRVVGEGDEAPAAVADGVQHAVFSSCSPAGHT